MASQHILTDPRLSSLTRITWVILINKPIYPLYVWIFVGEGVTTSLLSILSAPLYIAVLIIARRSSIAARVAFPLLATIDTIGETKLFGAGSATELFAAPAALIAALSFAPREAGVLKIVLVTLYVAFLVAHGRLGQPLFPWSDAGLDHLREINIVAVASLTLFVCWTFADRQPTTNA
jgi:hypothetical protein